MLGTNEEKDGCDCMLCQLKKLLGGSSGSGKSFNIPGIGIATVISGMGPIPFGLEEILSSGLGNQKMPCFRAERKNGEATELVIDLPHAKVVSRLLSVRKNISLVQGDLADQDSGSWKDFFNGNVDAFDSFSESVKTRMLMVERMFESALMACLIPLSFSSEDSATKMNELEAYAKKVKDSSNEGSSKEFLNYLASNKQDFENEILNEILAGIRQSLLNPSVKMWKKDLARFQEKEKRILAKLPEELHDVSEVPELRIPETVLQEEGFVNMIENYLGARVASGEELR